MLKLTDKDFNNILYILNKIDENKMIKRYKLLMREQNSKSQMDILGLENIRSDWIALLVIRIQQEHINRNHQTEGQRERERRKTEQYQRYSLSLSIYGGLAPEPPADIKIYRCSSSHTKWCNIYI